MSDAERRLLDLLDELRERPPGADPELADRVLRTARWQYPLRGVIVASSELAAAAGVLVRLLLADGRRR